jgi:hypothetical protein
MDAGGAEIQTLVVGEIQTLVRPRYVVRYRQRWRRDPDTGGGENTDIAGAKVQTLLVVKYRHWWW